MPSSSFRKGFRSAQETARKYQALIILLIFLFSLSFTARLLRGSILGGSGGPTVSFGSGTSDASLHTCSSEGTVFEQIENLEQLRTLYRQYVSQVVGERERILRTPSEWKCGTGPDGEPASPMLGTLANLLPGWHERVKVPFFTASIWTTKMRPVTFDAFSAILGEFQREYECKLTELQDRTPVEVSRNQDIRQPTQFCCVADPDMPDGMGCREEHDTSLCLLPPTDDPMCFSECSVSLTSADLSSRSLVFHAALRQERETSRVAMERTLHTLRSFHVNYTVARQLVCYQHASMDLKNEMGLLADAVSCMPKIWDAVTSLHD